MYKTILTQNNLRKKEWKELLNTTTLNYLILLKGKIGLHMSLWFIKIKCWSTKWGQLLVSSISVSGKDARGCSHGEEESPRSRISCSSHFSAHTSSFFEVQHSIRPSRSVKNKTRRILIPLAPCCSSAAADFTYSFLILSVYLNCLSLCKIMRTEWHLVLSSNVGLKWAIRKHCRRMRE